MKKSLGIYRGLSRRPSGNHRLTAAARSNHYTALASFQPSAWWQWLTSYLEYAFRPRHPFLAACAAPNGSSSTYTMPDKVRIGLAGDWGTGTAEAAAVAEQMSHGPDGELVDYTIHLGDVYYVGNHREIEENCLGKKCGATDGVTWPAGARGSFALNGNHEMYANGYAYFDTFLPTLGVRDNPAGPAAQQGPSFFCLENEHWRILGLDTGYNSVGLPIVSYFLKPDCRLPEPIIEWLRQVVQPTEKRNRKATIILSHHQYFSAFDENYPAPARQLAEFFDTPVIWLWGHEHRLSGYHCHGTDKLEAYGRCLGHGGMPVEVKRPDADNPLTGKLLFYDARINPEYEGGKTGFNGFAQLALDGDRLAITYFSLTHRGKHKEGYTPSPTPLFEEEFQASKATIHPIGHNVLLQDKDFVVSPEAPASPGKTE